MRCSSAELRDRRILLQPGLRAHQLCNCHCRLPGAGLLLGSLHCSPVDQVHIPTFACHAHMVGPSNHMYTEWAIRTTLQTIEYKLLASLNALNVVQSLIIFSGLAAGLTVCAKASTC